MPEDQTGTSTEQTPEQIGAAADAAQTGSTEAGAEGGNEGGQEPQAKPEDELPEWARTELTKVRGEAANYRTKLREAQDSLKNSKTVEEFEAATAQLNSRIEELEHDALRATVAAEHKLPPELAKRLSGKTKEELTEDAKSLAKFAPAEEQKPDPADGTGGLNPGAGEDDGDMDPRSLARKARGRRR